MSSKFARISLVILMVTHFWLAAWFAMITPYRTGGILLSQRGPDGRPAYSKDIGAPDERQHANYIGFLLRERKLPVFDPKSPTLYEDYQSHQPPLFYAVAETVAKVTGQTEVEAQSFGRTIRLLNCLIGAVGVAGVFFAGLWGTKRNEIAVIAASLAALLPTSVMLNAAISNDPLLVALLSWTIAWSVRGIQLERGSNSLLYDFLVPAILVGLALCCKSSALVGYIVFLGSTVASGASFKRWIESKGVTGRSILPIVIPIALFPLLLVSWLWVRNISLYGDPLAQSAFKEAFVGSAQKSAILGAIEAGPSAGSPEVQYWINWIGYWTARSFIGVFGYMDIWFNATGKANSNSDPNILYKAIILFNFLGLGGGVLWLRNNWQENKRLGAITLGLIGLTVALFVMFNNTYFQAQARYLFPALSAFATLMAIGWVQIFRKWQIALALVVIIFGGFTVHAGTQLPGEFAKRIQTESPSP
ncbi:MAG: hypothetical protein QE269_13055 [Fimbriimonas sp.]|nr:hypothetical protein [Fimbriimonas sp.]